MPGRGHRLTPLARVVARLSERGVPFAAIGAAAMAVHGVTRGTRDIDLLVVAPECLAATTWEPLETGGLVVEIRRGGADAPLAGVVRVSAKGLAPLDVVVGRESWQATALSRAREASIEGTVVPVVTAADLIVLKLYAGGPQDAWDIQQLLAAGDRTALVADVERSLGTLPSSSRDLWQRLIREPAS